MSTQAPRNLPLPMNVSNTISLIGRVGHPPTRKELPSGTPLLEFSLATNHSYKDRGGNRVTTTDWHRVKAFGPSADILDRYLNKGDQVALSGRLTYNEWTDKQDRKRRDPEVILSSFHLLGNSRAAKQNDPAPPGFPTTPPEATSAVPF